MVRVLFVDDEPQLLNGLRRMLRPWRDRWEMFFADGGESALAEMAERAFDVVVTDMRMPGIDGAQLLQTIATRYPGCIRMVLSRQFDNDAMMRAIGFTHRFLAKPCDGEVLVDAISRAVSLRDRMNAPDLREMINGLQSLPGLPALYVSVRRELLAAEPSMPALTEMIEQDPPLTAKLLQVSNFSVFGARVVLHTASQAIRHLGIDTLRALVLQHGFVQQLPADVLRRFPFEALWRRSLNVTALAREMAAAERLPPDQSEALLTAAALHDVGSLLLAVNRPDEYERILQAAAQAPRCALEQSAFAVSSPAIGAYLLDLWGLPHTVIEAVAFQAEPLAMPGKPSAATIMLHAAVALAPECPAATHWPGPSTRVDPEALAASGYGGRLAAWRALPSAQCPGL